MPSPEMSGRHAWECAYGTQGRLWGGLPFPIPPLPNGARVLELGCGNGRTTSALVQRAPDVLSIDSSLNACCLTRAAVAPSCNADIITADARALPFSEGSFDAIIAHHVIGHMFRGGRTAAARESFRVLKPAGLILFCDFSIGDLRAGRGTVVEENTFWRGSGIVTHYFTEEEVVSLFLPSRLRSVTTQRRIVRIRGKNLTRAEIIAIFMKN